MVFLLASCAESSGSLQGQETEACGETEVTQQTESVQETESVQGTESSGETDGELAFPRDQIVTQIISVKQNNGDNMYICGAF